MGLTAFCTLASGCFVCGAAIGIQFFGSAALLWWLIISINFFCVAVLDREQLKPEKLLVLIGLRDSAICAPCVFH